MTSQQLAYGTSQHWLRETGLTAFISLQFLKELFTDTRIPIFRIKAKPQYWEIPSLLFAISM